MSPQTFISGKMAFVWKQTTIEKIHHILLNTNVLYWLLWNKTNDLIVERWMTGKWRHCRWWDWNDWTEREYIGRSARTLLHKIANENEVLVRVRVRVTLSSTVYMKVLGGGGRNSTAVGLSVNCPVNLCTIITSIHISHQRSLLKNTLLFILALLCCHMVALAMLFCFLWNFAFFLDQYQTCAISGSGVIGNVYFYAALFVTFK